MNTVLRDTPEANATTPLSNAIPIVPLRMSSVLAAVTIVACLGNLLVPDLLSGTAVMNGSVNGTAIVALVVAVPVLAVSSSRARIGSNRALVVALASVSLLATVRLLRAVPDHNKRGQSAELG